MDWYRYNKWYRFEGFEDDGGPYNIDGYVTTDGQVQWGRNRGPFGDKKFGVFIDGVWSDWV